MLNSINHHFPMKVYEPPETKNNIFFLFIASTLILAKSIISISMTLGCLNNSHKITTVISTLQTY